MLFLLCTFLFLNAFSAATLAAGTGTGTGAGSGTDIKSFNFVGAYLTTCNGNSSSTEAAVTAAQVPVKPTIKIVFDKNVVYDTSWSNNEQAVNIFTSSGVKVPAQVFRISDQVNFEERQNIFITPQQNLNPGAGYKIVISPGLLAKSGGTLGMSTNNQPVVIQFTTQGETPAQTTGKTTGESLVSAPNAPQDNSNVNAPGINPVAESLSSSPTPGGTQKKKLSISSLVLYTLAGTFSALGCLWIGVRWFIRKRK